MKTREPAKKRTRYKYAVKRSGVTIGYVVSVSLRGAKAKATKTYGYWTQVIETFLGR